MIASKDHRTPASLHKRKKILVLLCLGGFFLGACLAVLQFRDPGRGSLGPEAHGPHRTQAVPADAKAREDPQDRQDRQDREKDLLDTIRRLKGDVERLTKDLAVAQGKSQSIKVAVTNDRHAVWGPSVDRDKDDPEFAAFLRDVAVNNEILVAVSNINYARRGGMLDLWMDGVKRSGVRNAMVVALDEETKKNVEARGVKAYLFDMDIPESQRNNGGNHAVSALKFRILKRFMRLGYSVLLSDVDIVTLRNPFDDLVRDSDVESMSDGYDDQTAYGWDDVFDDASMGWSRYAHTIRIFVFNSGLFYIRPTEATMELLDKVIDKVETTGGWDQALFNECIFFPNSPINKDPGVTRRAMDRYVYMNSKTLFRYVRHNPQDLKTVKPAMIHVNYHPNKFERMLAIVEYYVKGDKKALMAFPDGSE